MGISELIIPSNDTHRENFYRVSKRPSVEALDKKGCGCYITEKLYESDRCWVTYTETVTDYVLCPEHMREHLTPGSTIQATRFY